ncbi:MAG: transketolase [Deltaproteobacteria bacterium]|nr:transketolase [Deltaproteobacteria bacterium]
METPPLSASPGSEQIALAARTIRVLTVDAVREAGIGHIGLPLGCAELATVLYSEFLRHDPQAPDWPDRDRFVLSAGHGSMLLYSLLHLSGYGISAGDIERFRKLGSITPGHPEVGETPGVETTTGPLGQGVGNGVGMALAERILAARFGSDLVNHRTWVLASDGDMMEGTASESVSLAGHLGLGKLVVLYDDNGVTIDGPASLSFSEDVPARFEAYGWDVQRVDGHDPQSVRAGLDRALQSEDRPHLIACRTQIGRGAPCAGTAKAHGDGGMSDDATHAAVREALDWDLPPFQVPDGARQVFRAGAERGAQARKEWQVRLDRALEDPGTRALWQAMSGGQLPADLGGLLPDFRGADPVATRVASNRCLNALAPALPTLVGGSADLSGSNGTRLEGEAWIERGKFEGRNLHYGVREHGMAAIANGLALHGLRPFVGTFLVFSDYMRPSVRLAALMRQPVAFVFTHDSIFVGEDGPTHQPVEQIAALRAIPGLYVWRPGDARETAVAWVAVLERSDGPTALALTRQALPVLEGDGIEDGAARGGYVLVPERDAGNPELVLVGSGSEVSLAREAATALNAEGRSVRAVSLPCQQLFLEQDGAYRDSVLAGAPRLVIEAGVENGVSALLRPGDRFHGMRGFGASANYRDLAVHFGFTTERVLEIAREML